MKLNAIFIRKEPELNPKECVIEHMELLSNSSFEHFRKNLLHDHSFIERNIDNMFYDKNGVLHTIIAVNEETGDGILIDSSGSTYARYSSYAPRILPYIKEQIKMVCEMVVAKAISENQREFDLDEISRTQTITLNEGNGLGTMFATELSGMSEISDIEFFDDGVFEITLKEDICPVQIKGMEMK